MADAAAHGHEHHDERGFFTRWFMSTNHKDIGILYLFTSAVVGFIAVAFTIYMRLELKDPGVQYMCDRRRAPSSRAKPAHRTAISGTFWSRPTAS